MPIKLKNADVRHTGQLSVGRDSSSFCWLNEERIPIQRISGAWSVIPTARRRS